MPRESYIWDRTQQTFRPRAEVLAEKAATAALERSALPAPMVIRDNIGGIQGLRHPSTGEFIDSKSKFRAETAARGLTEVGEEAFPERRVQSDADLAREVAQDAAEAYDMLEAGGEAIAAKPLDTDLLKPELAKNV